MSPKRIVPVVLILGLGGYALWRFVLAPPADAAGLVASGTVEATDAQLGFQAAGAVGGHGVSTSLTSAGRPGLSSCCGSPVTRTLTA